MLLSFIKIKAFLFFLTSCLLVLPSKSWCQRRSRRVQSIKTMVFAISVEADPPKEQSKSSLKKARKLSRVASWRAAVKNFKNSLLSESYLALPVRASTVEAAEAYGLGCLEQSCLMPGTHKHLGGAYDATDGCIYGVPANSKSVLCLYPVTSENGDLNYRMKTIPLPTHIEDCNFKWLRGIFAHGYLWAIPSWANAVLCVDVDAFWGRREISEAGIVQLLDLPGEHVQLGAMQWQWHGAGINNEKTAIYCIPSNAQQVLKVDLITKTTSLIPVDGFDPEKYPNFSIECTNKWYGGIMGNDNCVYGIPYRSCAVLRINCNNDSATLVGPDFGNTKYNWHGGIQRLGKIYAHPSHAETVLVIDTNHGAEEICYELPIERAEYDKDRQPRYKWLGGSVGADGNIYCPACDTSAVLKIDVKEDKCTTFGFVGTEKNKVSENLVLLWGSVMQMKRISTSYSHPIDDAVARGNSGA
jgi:hypothetical protein